MAGPLFYDRVLQATTTTGTGTLTLGSAIAGHQGFSVVGDGNTCHAVIFEVDANGNPSGAWEVIRDATYTASGTTLSRGTLASSSTGSAINFGAGTKRVALIALPAVHANQYCSVRNTANQAIASGDPVVPITFDTELSDLSAMHSTGSNTSRINAIVPGVYLIQGEIAYEANAAGNRAAFIRKNGTTFIGGSKSTPSDSLDLTEKQVMAVDYLAAADYVELCAHQTSTVSLNSVAASPWLPSLRVVRIGP